MTQLMTSLAEIHSFHPCVSGWKDILTGQGKISADDVQFPLINCLDSNSFGDVCWLLGKRKAEIKIMVKAARMCAESVAHLKNAYAAAAADAAVDAESVAHLKNAADYAYAAAAYAAVDAAAADYAADYAAVDAAVAVDAAAADGREQTRKNKEFLRQCIQEFEAHTKTKKK